MADLHTVQTTNESNKPETNWWVAVQSYADFGANCLSIVISASLIIGYFWNRSKIHQYLRAILMMHDRGQHKKIRATIEKLDSMSAASAKGEHRKLIAQLDAEISSKSFDAPRFAKLREEISETYKGKQPLSDADRVNFLGRLKIALDEQELENS